MSIYRNTMYNKRTWLNEETSSSTSNIVCFDCDVQYSDKIYRDTFIKISDCKNSIHLHKKDNESMKEFISKLILLNSEIEDFINFLKNNENN